jgi:SPP1 family predicted phage head-tail adaptor
MKFKELDTRITIQNPTDGRDAIGGNSKTWSNLETVWASRKVLKGTELVEARQRYADVETKFVIRYSSDVSGVDPTHRILYGSVEHEILGAIPVPGGRPTKLEIYVKSRGEK